MPEPEFDYKGALADIDKYLDREKATDKKRTEHHMIFEARCLAASRILGAVSVLKGANAEYEDDRIIEPVEALIELARDLRDYDPSSD